jgi:hypothetical protein
MNTIQNKIFSVLGINPDEILKDWLDDSVNYSQKLSKSFQDIFDTVEFEKLNESNLYRIILRNHTADIIELDLIAKLISDFKTVLGNDECNIGLFNDTDKKQFASKSWLGRVWINFHTQNLSLVFFRSGDIFELRIITVLVKPK